MAFIQIEKVYHSHLCRGPVLAFIKKPCKVFNRKDGSGTFSKATFTINGKDVEYYVPDSVDPSTIDRCAGTSVTLRGSGDERQGNATLVIEPASAAPASQQAAAPARQFPQQSAQPTSGAKTLVEAKKFLAQSSNLMRACVKKALDIGNEYQLPDAHIQGIATTLFITSDRAGFLSAMPLEPFTPQDLGANAVKARQHVEEPESFNEEEASDIPF